MSAEEFPETAGVTTRDFASQSQAQSLARADAGPASWVFFVTVVQDCYRRWARTEET
jgi:hypothetical protein